MTTINMIPLDSVKHKNLRINVDRNYSHVSNQNMTPLLASEFIPASTNFPIVFVKQQETGKFKSVGLLGLDAGENLVFANNKVQSNYIPVNIRRYPFAAGGKVADESEMILCIDENSALLNENEGVQIFDEDGKPSGATEQVTKLLTDILAKDAATDIFIAFLVENDLLQPAEITLKLGEPLALRERRTKWKATCMPPLSNSRNSLRYLRARLLAMRSHEPWGGAKVSRYEEIEETRIVHISCTSVRHVPRDLCKYISLPLVPLQLVTPLVHMACSSGPLLLTCSSGQACSSGPLLTHQ